LPAPWARKYFWHLRRGLSNEKMSFARFSTDDTSGKMRGYVGEGRFTDDPLNTFGGAGVVEIPHLQRLLRFICERGFEHHVAANLSTVASAVQEAATPLPWVGTFAITITSPAATTEPADGHGRGSRLRHAQRPCFSGR